jgi:hypothetical protein
MCLSANHIQTALSSIRTDAPLVPSLLDQEVSLCVTSAPNKQEFPDISTYGALEVL